MIYGGRYLKDIGDLTNLQPTTLLISKAPKLTRLICTNNPNLINTDLSNCTMLQEIDLHGCSQLGGGIGSTPTLNVQKCANLRRINIYDTKLTAIYTNTSGGNIQEINYPFTVQTVQIHNQPNLTSIGIPVYFVENGNSNNKFATSLVSVDIANCTRLTSMVKNYYEKNGEPVPVPTFLGVSSAQSFKISNSLTHLEKIDLSYCANLRSLSISDFYNLLEINFDDICRWDATHSNLSEISITNCPYVETITFNQNTLDENNSLGVAFTKGMTLDLSDLLNLKHIRSNVGVKGLERLIVPPTVKTLVFDYPQDTQYSQQLSDVKTIVSRVAYEQMGDEYEGIDLRGIDTITDFSMGSLASIDRADNLNIKITNTFPYFNYFRESNFFEPTGSVDISDYTGSLAYLFKGISVDKLQIICNNQLTQTNASYMFAYASCDNEELITNLFDKMRNINNLSYMFYNSNIKKAPLLPLETRDCRYTFYNCKAMKQTPSNWNQNYTVTPQSQYCYTGCVGIEMIDNEPSTLDNIPTAWGGFGRSDKTYRGYEIYANDTLEREIEVASASGLSLHNLAKEYGTTPTVTHDQPSFNINEGVDSNILITEGEYDKALLHGQTYTNLVGRTGETQLFERQVSSFDISEGLESGVDVVDGEFVEAMLYGSTLQNIVVEDGKTSPITNKTKTFNIDDNIAEGELVANGEFASMVIKGNTLKNTLPKSGQTDIVEVRGHENVNSLVGGDLIPTDGEIEHLIMEGSSVVESGTIRSVKMPVLTTLNTTNLYCFSDLSDEIEVINNFNMTISKFISVEPSETIYFNQNEEAYAYVRFYSEDKIQISQIQVAGWTAELGFYEKSYHVVPENAQFMKILVRDSLIDKMMVNRGNDYLPYEKGKPYKSNILRTPEEVVLKGLGDVQDTLNVNTGEYVKRIGERPYQEGDEHDISVVTDFTKTQYVLETPITKTIDLEITQQNITGDKLFYHKDRQGQLTSNGTLPKFSYKLQSTNNYHAKDLKPNTTYTIYSDTESSVVNIGGKFNILLNSPQLVTSGSDGKNVRFESVANDIVVIEGDVVNQVVPYFTGKIDVVNPIVKTIGGNNSNTVQTSVTLRSVNGVRDTYDMNTGVLTKRISDNHEILDYPQTITIPCDTPRIYSQGRIEISNNSDLSLLPRFEYSGKSPNFYPLPVDKNTTYTLKFDNATNGSVTLGGTTVGTNGNQIITTKNNTLQGVLFERDLGIDNLMVIRGDVRDVPMSYFQGIKNVVNPTITLDNGGGESNSLTLTLTMRSLPNGTKDELNLVTGDYVQRLDERPYQEGDIESDNLLTDGVTTIYPLSSPRRRRLNLEWSNGVLKAFEGATNVTSEAEMLKPYLVVKLATSTLEDLLSKLKEENTGLLATVDKLEEDNLTAMIAVTEVFETVLVMFPFRMDEGISMGSTLKGGGSQMVEVYVTLILKGKKTIDQVPVVIRSQVEQMLKDLQTL